MNSIDPIHAALKSASSGMSAQTLRLQLSAENLSNADTPGYQRKLVSFFADDGSVTPSRVFLDNKAGTERFEPTHPLADANGVLTLSNVDMMLELADSREANRSFEANLQVFSQAKSLYENLWGILRR